MNWQQWNSVSTSPPPLGRWVAVTPGGYVMRGRFQREPVRNILTRTGEVGMDELVCYDWRNHRHTDILHWSWSETEPDQETLMVKPHGIFCAHWWNEVGCLLNVIHDFDVRFFVEIGLLDGGLAAMLWPVAKFDPDFCYYGIDLNPQNVDERLMRVAQSPGNFVIDQKKMNAWSPEVVEHIRNDVAIHKERRAMIYCDGGDKPREANLYWPILRSGDLLGVHDYSDDPMAKGPEVYPKDVADLLREGKRIGREALADTRILLLEKT